MNRTRVPLVATLAALTGVLALLVLPTTPAERGQGVIARIPADAATPRPEATRPTPTPEAARPTLTPEAARSTTAPETRPGTSDPRRRPPVVDHGPRTGNRVALTFDADMTDAMRYQLRSGAVRSYANLAIVDLLERERVPAAFFLTGKWVEEYPEVTRRLAGNPRFELANHTYGHLAFTPDCYGLPTISRHRMAADVARTFDVIAPYGGRQTRYFRFPGLCHDRAALTALAPLGVTVVDGDVVSGDPFAKSWRPIVDAVLSRVRPGSVVVLHVTEANAPMTDEALPHILAGLAERGLTPAPLSEVLGPDRSAAAQPG
ncbi:polysaccharide deacetylase family protein [Micromonospora sp. B11E3]|uniref:polysaccharide deacetylase family protein n=1 Tax=Micromonospora sp. B11E3 TaxID=3153562 RepID=UPI00325D6E8E